MAREIGALLDVPRKDQVFDDVERDLKVPVVRVKIEDEHLCSRYIATRIDGVTIGITPKDIAAKIEAVGGRSINNIVDITNFVLFDIGQPLHAFDAEKVTGGITVRLAKKGETMTTLDNKSVSMDGTELVIADDEGVLALAGIKGGKKAEVTAETSSIILECANFDPTTTRKTSQKHGIKTDASKRYENGMTSAFAKEGCAIALALFEKYGGGGVRIGETTDVYPSPEVGVSVAITVDDVNSLLGLHLTRLELVEVLTRAGHAYDDDNEEVVVTIPAERLDLRIKADMIEEVGRHIGYENIAPKLPNLGKKGLPNKRLYYANKIRKILVGAGFSEVFTYSFATAGHGDVEVFHPVGKDRPFMRNTLATGLNQSLLT
ncbi:MAG: Phenylalanine-tRNA ligase beta subunit, partial [Parcubacteria group bacterium GW2011_GWA2_47_7]